MREQHMVRFMIKVALATLIPKLVNETYEYLKQKELKDTKIVKKGKELHTKYKDRRQKRRNNKLSNKTPPSGGSSAP